MTILMITPGDLSRDGPNGGSWMLWEQVQRKSSSRPENRLAGRLAFEPNLC